MLCSPVSIPIYTDVRRLSSLCLFFFKQKSAYDMRISDWSSDVCSSDLEAYCKAQGMWHDENAADPIFTDTLELDMSTVHASLAGPKRPQDRISLNKVDEVFNGDLSKVYDKQRPTSVAVDGLNHDIGDGDVVIAAITI